MATGRYDSLPYLVRDGRLTLAPRSTPNTDVQADDLYATAGVGDSLQLIAWRLYGDAKLWWVLADFNDVVDPFTPVAAGARLRAPSQRRLLMEVLA